MVSDVPGWWPDSARSGWWQLHLRDDRGCDHTLYCKRLLERHPGLQHRKSLRRAAQKSLPRWHDGKAGYEHNTFKGGGIEYYIERGHESASLSQTRYGFHQDGLHPNPGVRLSGFWPGPMARALGKMDDYKLFMKRARKLQEHLEPRNRLDVEPHLDGKWGEPVDSLTYDHGWEEGTAAQYVWFVLDDVQGLDQTDGQPRNFHEEIE